MRDSGVFNKDMAPIVQVKKNRPGLWQGRFEFSAPDGRRSWLSGQTGFQGGLGIQQRLGQVVAQLCKVFVV